MFVVMLASFIERNFGNLILDRDLYEIFTCFGKIMVKGSIMKLSTRKVSIRHIFFLLNFVVLNSCSIADSEEIHNELTNLDSVTITENHQSGKLVQVSIPNSDHVVNRYYGFDGRLIYYEKVYDDHIDNLSFSDCVTSYQEKYQKGEILFMEYFNHIIIKSQSELRLMSAKCDESPKETKVELMQSFYDNYGFILGLDEQECLFIYICNY
jgi:hypothetical protein